MPWRQDIRRGTAPVAISIGDFTTSRPQSHDGAVLPLTIPVTGSTHPVRQRRAIQFHRLPARKFPTGDTTEDGPAGPQYRARHRTDLRESWRNCFAFRLTIRFFQSQLELIAIFRFFTALKQPLRVNPHPNSTLPNFVVIGPP